MLLYMLGYRNVLSRYSRLGTVDVAKMKEILAGHKALFRKAEGKLEVGCRGEDRAQTIGGCG